MIDKLSWIAVYPDIVLLVMACVIALLDLGIKSTMRHHLCVYVVDPGGCCLHAG